MRPETQRETPDGGGATRFLRASSLPPAIPVPRRRDMSRVLQAVREVLPEVATLRQDEQGRVVGRFYGSYITTTFQTWRRPDGAVVAQEAYVRSHSRIGDGLSPWRLFAETALDHELVALDRLCRTVHALNFSLQADERDVLFVNVDARLLTAVPERHGEFFGRILALAGIAPQQIVIDIPLSTRIDVRDLRKAIASYWRNGFRVALNAQNAVHASTLCDLIVPDFLMLEGNAVVPDTLQKLRQHLGHLGTKVIVKRIEAPAQLETAVTAGVELLQGFYLDELTGGATNRK
jgi:EAL domain-containing protein (putative c-di-GMP-specific phosphodiesterase class I)